MICICGVSLDLPADGRLYHTGPMHIRSNCGDVNIKPHYQHIFLHISKSTQHLQVNTMLKCMCHFLNITTYIQLEKVNRHSAPLSASSLRNEQRRYTKRGIGPTRPFKEESSRESTSITQAEKERKAVCFRFDFGYAPRGRTSYLGQARLLHLTIYCKQS